MTIEKSIGWTDMTINPIKGKCRGGCWYCWTKPLYKRKFLQPELNLNLDVFFKLPKSPKRIFLCSTHDLFGSWIPSWWRTAIFERIESNPQHTFQVLTKFPQNIDRTMPDNVWLGCSIENNNDWATIHSLEDSVAKIRFISLEPFLYFEKLSWDYMTTGMINWWIIGRLTGHGKKYDPTKMVLEYMVKKIRKYKIPIFMKDNLRAIWGDNLIQEFPK